MLINILRTKHHHDTNSIMHKDVGYDNNGTLETSDDKIEANIVLFRKLGRKVCSHKNQHDVPRPLTYLIMHKNIYKIPTHVHKIRCV